MKSPRIIRNGRFARSEQPNITYVHEPNFNLNSSGNYISRVTLANLYDSSTSVADFRVVNGVCTGKERFSNAGGDLACGGSSRTCRVSNFLVFLLCGFYIGAGNGISSLSSNSEELCYIHFRTNVMKAFFLVDFVRKSLKMNY